jgi:hypothetical protein
MAKATDLVITIKIADLPRVKKVLRRMRWIKHRRCSYGKDK